MEEPKVENFTGEAIPAQMPTPAAEPVSMTPPVAPQQPVEPIQPVVPIQPVIPPTPQQSYSNMPQPAAPEVERMQMPMQPIDLSDQGNMPAMQSGGMTMQGGTPAASGGNKKIIIIIGVVIAAIVTGVVAFFIWRSMSDPAPEAPITEQTPMAPLDLPPVASTTETVAAPVVLQPDDISVIENDLNTFNVGGLDAELQGGLAEITTSL